jgi:N-sulfoglucosamine sulfohydrolase
VPGFLPDTETTRHEMLDYAVEIEWFDSHLGKMLHLLEEAGELTNTIIVVTADNGMAFPRAKANNYEYGVHMPLIISWPAEVEGGRTIEDFVSLIDLAPTFLAAAKEAVPPEMTGKSLLQILRSGQSGRVDPSRTYVLSGRERHTHAREDNLSYPIRALHTAEFNYIRNLKPDRSPTGLEFKDVDSSPSHSLMLEDEDAKLSKLAYGQRPAEELYDKSADPYGLNNLASNPEYRPIMDRFWTTMQADLKKGGDPRMNGYGDIWESYPRYSKTRNYPGFHASNTYNPEFVIKAIGQMNAVGITNRAYEARTTK